MKWRWTLLAWPLGLVPLGWLVWQVVQGALGPDPAETFVQELGWWGLVMLTLSLAMRPVAQLFSLPGVVVLRRTFGLLAFGYITLHLLTWLLLLLGLQWDYLWEELNKRPYILIGSLSWLLLVPLAVTSTRKQRRRLGKKWVKLHKLVFPAVVLGVLHHAWIQKSDYTETIIFALMVGLLFIYRLLKQKGAFKK